MSSMKSNSNEQLLKTFWEMDRSMLQAHRGCETNRAQADDTAHALLEYAELSLLIRARTLMVLGCSDQPGILDHAKEAVRIAELAIQTCSDVSIFDHELFNSCQFVLKEAQEAYDAGGEDEDEEDPALAEQDPDEGGVIREWSDGKCVTIKDEEGMASAANGEASATEEKRE